MLKTNEMKRKKKELRIKELKEKEKLN